MQPSAPQHPSCSETACGWHLWLVLLLQVALLLVLEGVVAATAAITTAAITACCAVNAASTAAGAAGFCAHLGCHLMHCCELQLLHGLCVSCWAAAGVMLAVRPEMVGEASLVSGCQPDSS
jgi:hypothetical protein